METSCWRLVYPVSLILVACALATACTPSRLSHDDPAALARLGGGFAWAEPDLLPAGNNRELVAAERAFRLWLLEQLQQQGYGLRERSAADWLLRYSHFESRDIDQGGILSPQDQLARARQASREESLSAVHTHHVPVELVYDHLQLEILGAASGKVIWQGVSSRLRDRQPQGADQAVSMLKRLAQPLLRVIPSAG